MLEPNPTRPPWVPRELYPFEDRWLEVDGNVLHYVDVGTGPPLLLLNGNPSWSFGWRDVIDELSGEFRCIAPDYPGFGLSRAGPDYDFLPESHVQILEAFVERLGLDGLTVYGYAWGGPIGLGLAARHPERIRALVIGNTWAWTDRRLRVRLFAFLLGGPPGGILVERLNLILRAYLPLNLRRGRLSPAERAAYEGPFPRERRHILRVFPRALVAGGPFLGEVERGLAHLLDRPALIVWPDSDPGFGTAELHRWQALFPRARTVIIKRAGQFIDEDAPGDVADAIRDWWREVVEPGSRADPEP